MILKKVLNVIFKGFGIKISILANLQFFFEVHDFLKLFLKFDFNSNLEISP